LASFVPVNAGVGFGDVPAGRFYTNAVHWMIEEEITFGTAPGCFQPSAPATRGQVATFIYRFKDKPNGATEPFSDVEPGDFFADAVAWMFSEGITFGVTPTSFAPHRPVTRGEFATLLHRTEDPPPAGAEPFDDVDSDDFFAEAVAWMVEEGITTGVTPTSFAPDRPVTRAEIATFLYRLAGEPPVNVGADAPPASDNSHLVAAEALSFQLLNETRASLGLDPLIRDETMDAFARAWSGTMDSLGNLGHSDGPYRENFAWVSSGSISAEAAALRMHELWSSSGTHYETMTQSSFGEVGIGFWQSDDGWHATHVFR
jgi:hypothetical protein